MNREDATTQAATPLRGVRFRAALLDPTGRRVAAWLLVSVLPVALVGCGGGSRDANIALRKQVQTLQDENDRLEAQLAGTRAAETRAERPDVEADEDAFLFVTDRIEFGRLTGGFDADPDRPGDELLQVYVQPVDQFGDEFKAAGGFTITATTDDADSRQLGQWSFTAAEAADSLAEPVHDLRLRPRLPARRHRLPRRHRCPCRFHRVPNRPDLRRQDGRGNRVSVVGEQRVRARHDRQGVWAAQPPSSPRPPSP